MQDRTASDYWEIKLFTMCYSSFANINKLDRAKKRYLSSIEAGEYSVAKRKEESPSIKEKKY